MIEILAKLVLFTSIWVIGIKIVTADGMALKDLRIWAEKKVESGYKIFEPLLVCQWCMPSIHSLVGYFFYIQIFGLGTHLLEMIFMYPLCVAASSFVCGMTWLAFQTLSAKKDFYSNGQKYFYNYNKSLKQGNG